ncbi:MAG TPA: Flp pilus assembly protein CpaB [Desulfobacteraceae bacterium]|jgi:pilus assembly protein CpaB|nr:Flp pilus assembly protein CpaB [Desulfobacteraceae bacterium]HPJ68872.1 Flp pilus assembly protein CpaB [Desulfobacteraceae bacterium]HPQ28993.1 Flp pilus assembly protein CpaB [Desulfobacteraceae bacterium]
MSNTKALLISLVVAVFAMFLIFSYINSREEALLEMATPIQVIVAGRDIPEGMRIDSNMIEAVKVPQKFVQPGAFTDVERILNRNINVPVLKGTQILESMFALMKVEGIAPKIPADKRAFSVFVTDVTAVGQLIQPGDMVDLMVTFEAGSYVDGRGVSEEIITRTVLENILVLAVNQTSSIRRLSGGSQVNQQAPGTVFTSGQQGSGQSRDQIKTLTLSLSPREVQILNLSQEIGTISASLRSSFDSGKIENLSPLSAQEFLGIKKTIIPRSSPAWLEIRGSDPFSRY